MTTMQQPNALHVIVIGRVQGVGFRAFTLQAAKRRGCKGWVKNLADGNVEVHAEADESTLTDLLTELAKGPPWSHVSDMKVTWKHIDEEERARNFRILR